MNDAKGTEGPSFFRQKLIAFVREFGRSVLMLSLRKKKWRSVMHCKMKLALPSVSTMMNWLLVNEINVSSPVDHTQKASRWEAPSRATIVRFFFAFSRARINLMSSYKNVLKSVTILDTSLNVPWKWVAKSLSLWGRWKLQLRMGSAKAVFHNRSRKMAPFGWS